MQRLPMSDELGWQEAGCSRACRDGHTHKWGRCAYGVEPAPTLERAEVVPGPDGHPSLAYRSMDAEQVAGWLREQGYAVTVPMSDETTPGPDLREQIAEALELAFRHAAANDATSNGPVGFEALAGAVLAVVQPELDRCDAEIKELQEAAAIAHDIATDRRCLAREAVHRAEQAEAERDRLDVRLDEISCGFIKANRLHPISEDGNLCTTCKRPYPCPTVTALSSIDDHASEVIAERDQLRAANDRAKALATNAARTGCGAGWDLNPAEVLAEHDPREGAT